MGDYAACAMNCAKNHPAFFSIHRRFYTFNQPHCMAVL